MTPRVTILTYCAHPALAYGTLLVFKTLRTGFPTAHVEVYDNGSHPAVQAQIAAAANDVGASFNAMSARHYGDHLEWLLLEREHGSDPLILLDPDVVFWSPVEHWQFGDALIAGRLIPEQQEDGLGSAYTSHARLHPSLFWVPDVARLREEVAKQRESRGRQWDCVGPSPIRVVDGRCVLDDTLAALYEAFRDRAAVFTEAHLDCFDHIFHGSHVSINAGCEHDEFDAILGAHYAAASGNLEAIRGVWRAQDAYFASKHQLRVTERERMSRALISARALYESQGVSFDEAQVRTMLQGLAMRMSMMPKGPRHGWSRKPKLQHSEVDRANQQK